MSENTPIQRLLGSIKVNEETACWEWQKHLVKEHVPKGTLRRLEQAEAAIARVRELHEDYFHDRSDLDAVESLEAIGRALDGPQ